MTTLNYQTEGPVEDRTISWEWAGRVKNGKKARGREERKTDCWVKGKGLGNASRSNFALKQATEARNEAGLRLQPRQKQQTPRKKLETSSGKQAFGKRKEHDRAASPKDRPLPCHATTEDAFRREQKPLTKPEV